MQRSAKARYVIFGMLLMFVISSAIAPAIAAARYQQITVMYDDIKVVVNGVPLDKNDPAYREPFMQGGVTMVPARIIGSMAFNGVTSWDDNTKTLFLGPTVLDTNRIYKLSELEYKGDGAYSYLKHVDEAKDSSDTYRRDCLLRTSTIWPSSSRNSYNNYSLKRQFSRIEGVYFLQYDSRNTDLTCDFKIWGDGKLLYSFEGMTGGTPPIPINLDIKGVETLKIGFEHYGHKANYMLDCYNAPGVGFGDVKLYP